MRTDPHICEVRGIRVGDLVRVSAKGHRGNKHYPTGLMVVVGFDDAAENSIADLREIVSSGEHDVFVINLEKVENPDET